MQDEARDRYMRVAPDHPNRCQGNGRASGEQCPFRGVEISEGVFAKHCAMHAGDSAVKNAKRAARKLYDVQKYRERMDRMQDVDSGAYLDEELAVLRMTLETCLQKYEDVELVTQSGQISGLITSIERVLTSNKKLKSQMGELMDRAAINRLCDELVGVIAKRLPAHELDSVAADVAGAVARAVASRMEGS